MKAPPKENLVEPYLSINQHQSESISINQHLTSMNWVIWMTLVTSIASMGWVKIWKSVGAKNSSADILVVGCAGQGHNVAPDHYHMTNAISGNSPNAHKVPLIHYVMHFGGLGRPCCNKCKDIIGLGNVCISNFQQEYWIRWREIMKLWPPLLEILIMKTSDEDDFRSIELRTHGFLLIVG